MTNYNWDYENRLTKVQLHQDKWVGLEYDGDGNRITKLSAMTQPEQDWHDNGKGNDSGFTPPGKDKVKKQQADLMYMLLKNDKSNGGGNGGGNSGGNGGGNSGGNSGGNNGNGQDKDKSDNGLGNGKDKSNNGKSSDVPKNKDLKKEDREAKKEKAKEKQGYRKKGKYNNKGKHLGWYKNGKIPVGPNGEKVEVTYYLDDISDPLTQVLMTYGEDGKFDAAYTYGLERIEVEAVDETRPEAQDPLYYLYDGLGSVTFMVKPGGNMRDHYRYDEFGKPAPGNSKLSPDGAINLNNTFGYTGEMWDEESNLLYLRARYYEPETGRFLSRDSYEGSIMNPIDRNLYQYTGNNPINHVDPSGHIYLRSDWLTSLIGPPKKDGHILIEADDNPASGSAIVIELVPVLGIASIRDLSKGDIESAITDLGIDVLTTITGLKLAKVVAKAGKEASKIEKIIENAPEILVKGIQFTAKVQTVDIFRDELVLTMYRYLYNDVIGGSWVNDDIYLMIDQPYSHYSILKNRINEIESVLWQWTDGVWYMADKNNWVNDRPGKAQVWDNLSKAYIKSMQEIISDHGGIQSWEILR